MVLEFAVAQSRCAVSGFQLQQSSAPHHSSIDASFWSHYDSVCTKYLPILSIACLCVEIGSAENLAHLCM